MSRTLNTGAFLFLVCLMALAVLAAPHPAEAKEYTITQSNIHAKVGTDGVVTVTEDREFRFVGQSTYVYWDLSSTYGEQYGIESVGELAPDGTVTSFTEGQLGTPGTYSVSSQWGRVLVRLHLDKTDTRATFRLSYKLVGDVGRHADVSELYWRFIPENLTEGQQAANVRCSIELPVPDGVDVVFGQGGNANVVAWDHGSLDASVQPAEDGSIVYSFPHVKAASSEYAEAHVVFPAGWLPDMASDGWPAFSSILQQEGSWSYMANSVRAGSLLMVLCLVALFLVVTLVCFVVFRRYGRNHRARFDGDYWRQAPSADHPAVIGYVWSEGDVRPRLLLPCILHLAEQGYVAIAREKLPAELASKHRGKTELVAVDAARAGELSHPIDRAAMAFLAAVAGGRPVFAMEDLRAFARQDPAAFRRAYEAWRRSVADAGAKSGYIEKNHRALSIVFGVVSFAMVCGYIAVLSMAMGPGLPAWAVVLAGVVPLACAVGVFAMALFSMRRNREATEIQAKGQALNRWLKDLPRLDESLPADAAFWRRLFVVASALDNAETALSSMRRAVPQAVAQSEFQRAFGWCYTANDRKGDVKLLGYNDMAATLADAAASLGGQ